MHFNRYRVSRDGEQVMIESKSFHIGLHVHAPVTRDVQRQWRFYVGAGGAIAPPVFGFAPPVWHAPKIVTMNNITLLSRLYILLKRASVTVNHSPIAVSASDYNPELKSRDVATRGKVYTIHPRR